MEEGTVRVCIGLAGSLLLLAQALHAQNTVLTPVNLTTEMRVDPVGVGDSKPVFGLSLIHI